MLYYSIDTTVKQIEYLEYTVYETAYTNAYETELHKI